MTINAAGRTRGAVAYRAAPITTPGRSAAPLGDVMDSYPLDSLSRVVVNQNGHATSPATALAEHNITPDVIFVRNDGWSLGAPFAFERVARGLWEDSWVARYVLEGGVFVRRSL